MTLLAPSDAIVAPRCLLRGETSSWNLVSGSMSPGQTASGGFPFATFPGGGLWQAAHSSLALKGDDAIRAFRAIRSQAKSAVVPIIVYRNDGMLAPWPVVNGRRVTTYGSLPHSDDSFFSDDSGYVQPVISASVVSAADVNATSITIRFDYGGPPRGGESFSLFHASQGWRLYEIGFVTDNGNGTYMISFTPWLRDAVAAGDAVEFDAPRCTMRMADPSSMNMALPNYKLARPDASFIEYFFTAA